MTEFRHTIGDALYELDQGDWDGNGNPPETLPWPVTKTTERFVYVHGGRFYNRDETYRLDRAVLERDGSAYHRPAGKRLHVRPGVDWPLFLADVSDGTRALAAAP